MCPTLRGPFKGSFKRDLQGFFWGLGLKGPCTQIAQIVPLGCLFGFQKGIHKGCIGLRV